MPDSKARLLEAAMRPFSDNAEMKLAAVRLLNECVKPDADGLENIAERWEATSTDNRRFTGRMALWTLLCVISAAVWIAESGQIIDFEQMIKLVSSWEYWPPNESVERVASKLNEQQKMLIFGDLNKNSRLERKEALWQSDPDNPVYFAEYVGSYYGRPNVWETAQRIDPNNAWFTYAEAGKVMVKADHKLKLLSIASRQKKCTSYATDFVMLCLPLVKQRTILEYLDSISCRPPGYRRFIFFDFDDIEYSVAYKADELGETGDSAGFHKLSKDGGLFLSRIINDDAENFTLPRDGRVFGAIITEHFASAAEKLGLQKEANYWKHMEDRLKERQAILKKQQKLIFVDGRAKNSEEVTGLFTGEAIRMSAGKVVDQPLLTDGDLKAGRMLDHAVLSWACVHACWILMGICLGMAVAYRFRGSILTRRLAGRMEDLIQPGDWAWISGLGVLLPFAYVMAINRLTPLGGTAFGMLGTGLLMPAAHFLALLILWLIVPVHVIRWRLAKRAGLFGFSKPTRISWLAVACAVAFVPLVGWAVISHAFGDLENWMRWHHPKQWPLPGWLAVLPLAVCLLWLATVVSLALFGRPERQMHRTTSSRILGRTLAVAMIALILAAPAFKASERYWFAQDKLCKIDPSLPAWSVYEYKVAEQQKKELREILGDEP